MKFRVRHSIKARDFFATWAIDTMGYCAILGCVFSLIREQTRR
jgi:hypothetical protein